jgi:uncharacterized membrane protein
MVGSVAGNVLLVSGAGGALKLGPTAQPASAATASIATEALEKLCK